MPEVNHQIHIQYHVILEEQQTEGFVIILNVSCTCGSALQRNTEHLHLRRTFILKYPTHELQ